jgi:hypothetical protein
VSWGRAAAPRTVPVTDTGSVYVVSLDQRSREAGDLVPVLLRRLGDLGTVVPFQRARPHAVQGITADPDAAVAAALAGLRGGAWSVGIGVGPVRLETATDPEGRAGLRADGPGTVQAHRAAGTAALAGRVPVCVAAADAADAARAQAVLRLLGRIVAQRTDAEWRVVDLLVPGARGQQKVVAAELGITPQAVSKAVARSLWQEEWDARPAAARLLQLCEPAGTGPQASTRNPSETIHS